MSDTTQLGLFGAASSDDDADVRGPRTAPTLVLVVVRGRGQALQKSQQPGQVVWTHGEFFDRVRQLAFLDEGIVLDDAGLVLASASVLTQGNPWGTRIAHDLAALHRALQAAHLDTQEVRQALATQSGDGDEREGDLLRFLTQLHDAERLLRDAGLVTSAQALALGVHHVERGVVPKVLQRFERVVIEGLIDPSEVQVRALRALALQGVPLTVQLPFDAEGRGLTQGVQWIKDVLEAAYDAPDLDIDNVALGQDAPLRDFVDGWYQPHLDTFDTPSVSTLVCADAGEEARTIAQVVSAWRRSQTPSPSVGVCLRTFDRHAFRIASAIEDMGVAVRIRRGKPVSQTSSGRLLLDMFLLRRDGVPRERLLAMLVNPLFVHHVPPAHIGRLARTLRDAAARTDVEDATRPTGGYAHRLARHAATLRDGSAKRADVVDQQRAQLEEILDVLYRIPLQASVATYFEVACQLVQDTVLVGDNGETEKLVEVLEVWMQALARLLRADPEACQHPTELPAFLRLLRRVLDDEAMPPPPCSDHLGVELISLPEAAHRRFDHLVIADCVHGRLPKAPRKDPLLSDADRIAINRALGRRALRLQEPDLLEPGPLPPRQALEPLFFAEAACAAQQSLLLTSSARNTKGQEQARSEFFQEALLALGAHVDDVIAGIDVPRDPHPREMRLRLAHHVALHDYDGHSDDDDAQKGIAHIHSLNEMRRQRDAFFRSGAATSERAPFAYAVDPHRLAQVVGHLLGMSAARPLTPTRLEALAQCRFRGFVEHLLRVDTFQEAGQDGDVRALGTLAHEVMEVFFKERRQGQVPPSRMTKDDLERLDAIIQDCAKDMLDGKSTGHLAALRANIAWLSLALKRTVVTLARNPPVDGVAPTAFEIAVGLDAGDDEVEHAFPPALLPVGERQLYFGGIIDRVDKGAHARVVIDYKNSTGAAVRRKVHPKKIFSEHFQLPLYLRLLEEALPSSPQRQLYAYLVSLRDACASDVLGMAVPLRPRILDDEAEDGLAQGLHRVLTPLLDGTVVPDEGFFCDGCRIARVCRIPRGAFAGATLRVLDQGMDDDTEDNSNDVGGADV